MSENNFEQWFYDITPVASLPRPDDLERPECMRRGITTFGRLWRQLRPSGPQKCCWFHGGSWHQASAIAVEIVEGASARGHVGEDLVRAVRADTRGRNLSGWVHEAVDSLLSRGEPINIGSPAEQLQGERGYVGGRHRALAMMQQGVRQTVTMHVEIPD